MTSTVMSVDSFICVEKTDNTATLNIIDNDAAELSIVSNGDTTEGDTTPGSFTISLPVDLTASVNTVVTYSIAGTATNGCVGGDYTTITTTATILAGQTSVNVAIESI